jgi:type III secretion protein R
MTSFLPTMAVANLDKVEGVTAQPATLFIVVVALSTLPFILLLTTSFVKIAVVLSLLRSALGTPQIPPSQVITGLALILTVYVMAPTGERMVRAIEPVLGHRSASSLLSEHGLEVLGAAVQTAKEPLREFVLRHSRPQDRNLFYGLTLRMRSESERLAVTDHDFLVVVPAFITSELRRAFEIGFLLFIPFLVVDLVIANLLLALGMHMLSPGTVSLPFKLLLFVLADGWQLLLRGLVESYV